MDLILANPRGFCAGVVRAIETVEHALERHGGPVYVLHEIVHNRRVVAELAARGAVFVERLAEVPDGAPLVLSAHGVARRVEADARGRGLAVIDATCPLVAKVHREVEQHARDDTEVVLIGHAGHPEVQGTLGRYAATGAAGSGAAGPGAAGPGARIHLVGSLADVAALEVANPARLAWVTQTTLSVDDTATLVAALEVRFPAIVGPRRDDICYATQNRQRAVRELTADIDLLLVVGAPNSSNTARLRELGERLGVTSRLVPEAAALDPAWLSPGLRIGITAGASAPESIVRELVAALERHGAAPAVELPGAPERVTFAPPATLSLDSVRRVVRAATPARVSRPGGRDAAHGSGSGGRDATRGNADTPHET